MGSRTWIKIYCEPWLNGTIQDETPELRGIWVDLLVLAGSGKYGDSGVIKITDEVGYSDSQLADLLHISRQKWATIKKRLIDSERIIVENLNRNRGGILKKSNIIVIINWSKYQSEYNRQKVYRQSDDMSDGIPEKCNEKLQPEVTSKSTCRDRDKRAEIETIERDSSSCISLSKKEVMEAYDQNIGAVTEDIENEIDLAIKRFTAPWVVDAVREAVLHNKHTWVYVVGVLKNWEREGRDPSSGQ